MKDPTGDETQETGLRDQLERWGVTKIVVCGLATDYCVKATVLDGIGGGFEVILLEDAVRPVDLEPGDGDRALQEMVGAGCTMVEASAA